jgi:hypothetical protein
VAESKGPPPAELTTPIPPDASDPQNWREINRLQRLAEWEGREFDPQDPYNWKGINASQGAQGGSTPAPTDPAPGVTAPGDTPGAVTPGTSNEVDERNKQLFSTVSKILQDAGLGSLFSIGPDGAPGGALWDQITNGIDNEAAITLWFEGTPEFQARYPIIGEQRAKSASGAPALIPTPGQVREFEQRTSAAMRQAGLPAWFYDEPGELQRLMGQGMSAVEVEARLGEAWTMVRNTDPAVSSAFQSFFGVGGDAAMAAFFLDPTRTMASLERAARTAYTSGMGSTVGLAIGQTMADRIASLPKTEAGIWQDLTQVSSMTGAGGVFDEGFTETQDLTAEGTGIDAVVFGTGDARNAIEKRQLERSANSRSSLGGAALTQAGAVGVSRG